MKPFAAVGLILLATLSGCIAMQKDITRVEARMMRFDSRLREVEGTAGAIEQNLNEQTEGTKKAIFSRLSEAQMLSREMRERLNGLEGEIRAQAGQFENLTAEIMSSDAGTNVTLLGRVEALEEQLATLRKNAKDLAQSFSGLSANEPNSKELYTQGRAAMENKEFAKAKDLFNTLIRKHPGSSLVSNAHFWVGEIYFGDKDYINALDKYKIVIEKHGSSSKAPDAYLKTSMALKKMGEKELSKAVAEELIQKYPQSAQVEAAKKLAQ